jgi:subtilase family serine protease
MLVPAGIANDEVEINPFELTWRAPVRGVPFQLHYSWLECDLRGTHCSPVSGVQSQTIVPPQEQRIVTLRGVVTGTNRYGSRSVVSRNFFYDMAGMPFGDPHFPRRHLQYDPSQLRAWYGLTPAENGAGQTIVITAPWRVNGALGQVVRHFSAHYGLPQPCSRVERSPCFKLAILRRGSRPHYSGQREVELDAEWAHAIAPAASIDVLQSSAPEFLIARLVDREKAHVFSSSWSWNRHTSLAEALYVFRRLARGCGAASVVCTWASGDAGHPGQSPANSPDVLAVGGTVFRPTRDGAPTAESAWPHSGGGTTRLPEERPAWQSRLPCDPFNGDCTEREIPDVSATAKAVPQYDSGQVWQIGGGTSLAAPLWAALIAIADQELERAGQLPIGIGELHRVLYRGGLSAGLDAGHGRGWNAQTGVGSPKSGIVPALVTAIERFRAAH